MEYPVRSAEGWRAIERPSAWLKVRAGWRSLRARASLEVRLRRRGLPTLRPVTGPVRALGAAEVVLLCVTKDAIKQLPALLAHYRRMGVSRFAFVDDRSADGSHQWLAEQDDVDLFTSEIAFRAAKGGLLWRDALIDLYGRGRWYLSIDSDEYLVFPGMESRPLAGFVADLERHGLSRAHAPMIDIYPAGRLGDAVTPSGNPADFPTAASPLYDGTSYTIAHQEYGTAVRGGPRQRLYGADMRMSKFPLLYADRGTRLTSGSHHGPLPFQRNFLAPHAVLLHHKFPAGAVADFHAIAKRGTHSSGSEFYRTIVAHEGFGEDTDLRYAGSLRFEGSEALVRQGFIKDLRPPR